MISDTTFKFYPSQIHTQAPIGLAIELRPQVNISEIESIGIQIYKSGVSSPATEPEKWDPQTRETADHSIPFLVAMALQDGAVTPGSFAAQRIADPSLRDLMGKMTMSRGTGVLPRNIRSNTTAASRLVQPAASAVSAETSYPKGHKQNPLSDGELEGEIPKPGRGLAVGQAVFRGAGFALERLEEAPNLTELFDAVVV